MYSVEVENITFSYNSHMVLSDLSFHFPAGKITCLSGPSGCGKTSLLRLIAGLEILQEGIIKIND